MMRSMFVWTLVLCLATGMTAQAQVVTTLHFDNVPDGVQCDQVWQENGIALRFTATTPEDCDGGGSCFFGAAPGDLWLFPARLLAEFGESHLVYRVEIDMNDNCGIGCTRAFLYNGGALIASATNSTSWTPEILVMDLGSGQWVDTIAVSSCEGEVLGTSIRITSAVVNDEATSFGTVKALYR